MWGIHDSDWWSLLAILVSLGVALGWVLFVGVPMVWQMVKPLIHAITG